MFQKLIQGFDTLFHSSLVQMSHGGGGSLLNTSIGLDMLNAEAHKVFSSFESGGGTGGGGASSSSSSSPAHSNSAASLGRSIYPYEIAPLVPINPNSADMLLFQQQTNGGPNQALPQSTSATPSIGDSTGGQQQQIGSQQTNNGQLSGLNTANSVYGISAELLRNMLDFMQHDVSDDDYD